MSPAKLKPAHRDLLDVALEMQSRNGLDANGLTVFLRFPDRRNVGDEVRDSHRVRLPATERRCRIAGSDSWLMQNGLVSSGAQPRNTSVSSVKFKSASCSQQLTRTPIYSIFKIDSKSWVSWEIPVAERNRGPDALVVGAAVRARGVEIHSKTRHVSLY